ncbi:MAG: Ig-like domain-containing protein, partial [Plesiomonas sp.]
IALLRLEITPPTWTMPIGGTNQYRATGIYNNGARFNLTNKVVWNTSATNPIVATIDSNGIATGTAAGNIQISATFTLNGENIGSNVVDLTVWSADLVSLEIRPTEWVMPVGANKQFLLFGKYNNGSTYPLNGITGQGWTPSNPTIANISNTGLATGLLPGQTIITATVWQPPYTNPTVNKTANLTVFDSDLASVVITPETCITPVGGTNCVYTVLAQYSGVNGTFPVPSQYITWSNSPNNIASLDQNGQATGLQPGQTSISATVMPPSGTPYPSTNTANLTVFDEALASIEISPNQHTTSTIGSTKQYQAFAHYNGIPTPIDITSLSGKQLQWSSSGTAAMIDPATGIATAQSVGDAFITATLTSSNNSTITPDLAINDDSNGDGQGDATLSVIDIATACEGVGLFVPGTGCFSTPPTPYRHTWSAASSYCATLTTGGATWILPDSTQLRALDTAYTTQEFINEGWTVYTYYWSSTAGGPGQHVYYNLSDGSSVATSDTSVQSVTCLKVVN